MFVEQKLSKFTKLSLGDDCTVLYCITLYSTLLYYGFHGPVPFSAYNSWRYNSIMNSESRSQLSAVHSKLSKLS